MTQSEISKHFERCEFGDECDFCNDPQEGSYVEMAPSHPGSTPEANFYICGKCAPAKIVKIEAEIKYWENVSDKELDRMFEIE